MKQSLLALFLSSTLLFTTGCSTILSKTTGPEAIGTDKSQRSFGQIIDDELIETYVKTNLLKANPDYGRSHVNVVSYNGIVLLVGEVQSAELQQQATATAKQVSKVRRVHNEITVAGPISIVARGNDAWLKTKIKTRALFTKGANPVKVKVVVENGVVYLMGLVSHAQAEQAVTIAHKTYGIQKIVKVFEYID